MTLPYRAHEITIRRSPAVGASVYVHDTAELIREVTPYFEELDREIVLSVILDDINRLLGIYEVSRGGVSEAPVEFGNVFRPAILVGGRKIIVVHNHPTGDPAPSGGDVQLAKGLVLTASLLDLDLADNIIVAGEKWVSVHEDEEFVRWFEQDIPKIAGLMAGGKL